jgi:hypothetical protein
MGNRFNNNFNNFRYNYNCGCNNGFMPGFGFNPGLGFGSNLGLGYGWGNGFRNPISSVIAFKNPRVNIGGGAGSNVTAFKNKTYGNVNLGYRNPKTGVFETGPNNNNSFGNLVKRVFSTATTIAGAVNNDSWDRASRSFSNSSNGGAAIPSSNAGGNSGGVKSTGSSATSGRGGRDN